MASFGTRAPAPVAKIEGVLRSLSTFEGGEKSAYPGQEAGRAQVLTMVDGIPGGYIEVYVSPQLLAAVPRESAPVEWVVEVDSFTERNAERGTAWSRLTAKLVRVIDTVTGEVTSAGVQHAAAS